MSFLFYVRLYIIPFMVLAVLLIYSRSTLPASRLSKMLRAFIAFTMCALVANAAAWELEGIAGDTVTRALWISVTLDAAFTSLMACTWFVYARRSLIGSPARTGIAIQIGFLLPIVTFFILLAVNPWTHWLFSIDDNNRYQRGSLIFVFYALVFCYLAATSFLALRLAKKEKRPEKRTECLRFAAFFILPLFAGLLQVIFYGTALLLPAITISVLLVYFHLQHKQMDMDSLTGLCGRLYFDRQLAFQCEHSRPGEPWYLVTLDADDLKLINDTYGHAFGDEALCIVAEALRSEFEKFEAFVARVSGDEFMVIIEGVSEEVVARAIADAQQKAEELGHRCDFPYRVSMSGGFARYEGQNDGGKALTIVADGAMYAAKAARRVERAQASRG